MSLPFYRLSVPIFRRMLSNLARLLEKTAAQARTRGLDETALLDARLYPDMLPLVRQVQILTDGARGAAARLAGLGPAAPDDPDYAVFNRGESAPFRPAERDLAALIERVARAAAYLEGIPPASMDAAAGRRIEVCLGGQRRCFAAEPFLLDYALPNFYFHLSVAYAILRHNGIELGKADFEGPPVYTTERLSPLHAPGESA